MKSGRGPRLGRARPARLGATAARRRVAVLLSWRERQRQGAARTACALKWRGVSGAARQRGGSEAARPRQRRSEAASARALKCLRARAEQGGKSAGERERREKESGERKENVNGLIQCKLNICN